MARRAFYSFHYKPDSWRASKVRNMGVIEGNRPATDNDWESIVGGGDKAIEEWIESQMYGKSVVIVLIGAKTAGRKWINHEIRKAWKDKRGLLGIHIHNITDHDDNQSSKGNNPFASFTVDGKLLSSIVKTYDPPYLVSGNVYNYIKDNLEEWIEKAIEIRGNYD